ncbi:hypothetical protein ACFX13_011928 [Malus domestica]
MTELTFGTRDAHIYSGLHLPGTRPSPHHHVYATVKVRRVVRTNRPATRPQQVLSHQNHHSNTLLVLRWFENNLGKDVQSLLTYVSYD